LGRKADNGITMRDFRRMVKINMFEDRGDNTYRELLLTIDGLLLGLKCGALGGAGYIDKKTRA
jgi:hypothetical protein